MSLGMSLRKRMTYLTIAFYFLCDGIEYAIVFPTIWQYLQKLGAKEESFLGLSVAAYSISNIIFGPAIGRLYDKTKNAKLILIIMNVFEAIGSFMYFAAFSPWFLICSRLVCGVGNSGGAAMIADITSSTELKTRTAIISNLQACRQIGLLTGPVFNLALRHLDFKIGHFFVNKMTAPGLFMVVLGVLLELMYIFMYHNLVALENEDKLTDSLHNIYEPTESDAEEDLLNSDNYPHIRSLSLNNEASYSDGNAEYHHSPRVVLVSPIINSGETVYDCPDAIMESAEAYMSSVSGRTFSDCAVKHDRRGRSTTLDHCNSYGTTVDTVLDGASVSDCFHRENLIDVYKDEFLRDEVVAVLGLAFVSFFAQTSMETIVTPLSQKYFGFGDYENSLLFLFAGIEILLAFLLINFLSRRIGDRILILSGAILMLFSLVWFLCTVPHFQHHDWSSLPYFAFGIFINLFGISLLIACTVSLFSKIISVDHQGFGHGLRRTLLSAGTIVGPLWGGGAAQSPLLLFSVPLAVVALFLILFTISFSRLDPALHEWRQKSSNDKSILPNEKSPLLSNRK